MMLRVAFSLKIFSSMTLLQLKSLLPLPALLPLPVLLRILLRPLLEKHACVNLNLPYFTCLKADKN
jgi:hypothetical protein